MGANLARRIAALESKIPAPCPAWSIFVMPAGVDKELIVGFQYEEQVIMRESGETLAALQKRANTAVVSSALTRIWRPLVAKSDEQILLT